MSRRAREILVLLLAAWMGAVVLFAAVVAPALFRILPERALAGALVSQILPPLFLSGALLGALAMLGARGMVLPGRSRAAAASGGVLLACGLIAQGVIAPAITRIRDSMGGVALASLPADDTRRRTFGRLHAYSVLALGVGAIGALGATVALVRQDISPTAQP